MTTQKIFGRDFILNFIAQFAFSSGLCVLIPTIPIYLSRFELREGEIGFLIGALSVSSLVLRPLVGRTLVKIPERKFMMTGATIFIFTSIAYLWASPFWPFLIVRILQGIGLAFFSTAWFTLIANGTPEIHRGQIISYYYLSINFALALGPTFGMLLINRFGFTALFLVCAGLSLCSLLTTIKLRQIETIPSEDRLMKDQPFLSREALPPAIMAFMLNVIWGTLGAFFPLYALRHGVSNPGIFFAFLAITLIFGRALGAKVLDVYDRAKVIIPCLIAVIISLVILTFSTNLVMFILAAIIWGIGLAFLYPSLIIYAIDNSGCARGHAMGTFTAIADLGTGVGPMIMGIILQWTSYPVMFSCLILTGIINVFYFCSAIRKG